MAMGRPSPPNFFQLLGPAVADSFAAAIFISLWRLRDHPS